MRLHASSAAFIAVLAVLLFTSAGTLRFWQAWIYLGLNAVAMAGTNAYLVMKDPALLERRLAMNEKGETSPVQRVVMGLGRAVLAGMLVVAGLDRRFGWSTVPTAAVAVACGVFAAGSLLIFVVMRENTYASSVIETDATQTVVSTGPYRLARHPMYAGAVLMALAAPLALGSSWAELLSALACLLIVVRLLDEERFLAERLRGYREYMAQTRSRLIPGVW
jgi:protein-S-isoprenylcysteine O-methyltransferase Ste14